MYSFYSPDEQDDVESPNEEFKSTDETVNYILTDALIRLLTSFVTHRILNYRHQAYLIFLYRPPLQH